MTTSTAEILRNKYAKRGNNLTSFYRENNEVQSISNLKVSHSLTLHVF